MVVTNKNKNFPFSAVIGQDRFKLTLILNLIDPLIGGVLAIGDKGTGKTTLIRSLTHLVIANQHVPFVNLPIGVSEDRLMGSIDLEQLINNKKEVVNPGLMTQAHQGVLYIDEVNLLQDYLTDILLDASSSGCYYLEREGVSRHFKSQFCLVGSMNPEEGELRPQFKDRFGLSVLIKTPIDVKIRQEIIKRRLEFDDNPSKFLTSYQQKDKSIALQIEKAKTNLKTIEVNERLIAYCSQLAAQNNVEGLRADILLLKTARAFAAYHNATKVTEEHVDQIADFVLNHRRLDTPQSNENRSSNNPYHQPQYQESSLENTISKPNNQDLELSLLPRNEFEKHRSMGKPTVGAITHKNPSGNLKTRATRKTVSQYLTTDKFELKTKREQYLLKEHHIFLIDSSGSMLRDKIIRYAKGTVNKIALKSKNQSTQFSIVSLFDGDAQHLLQKTRVLKQVEDALLTLKTGGKTNLVAGLKLVKRIGVDTAFQYHLHIITDGKLCTETHTLETLVLAYQTYCKAIHHTQVIDVENARIKIGIASEFASRIGANYETLITENDY